jgi:hypothetical protein
MMKKTLVAVIVGLVATGAQAATITLNLGGGEFQDGNGDALFTFDWGQFDSLDDGQLFLLIGDVDGNGFASINAIHNNQGFLAADDVLIEAFGVDGAKSAVDGELNEQITGYDAEGDGFDGGEDLALVWFETLLAADVDVDTDTPGLGQKYGYDTTKDMPSPPSGDHDLIWSFTGDAGETKNTTVPEPASMLLLTAGAGLLAVRRRRRRA